MTNSKLSNQRICWKNETLTENSKDDSATVLLTNSCNENCNIKIKCRHFCRLTASTGNSGQTPHRKQSWACSILNRKARRKVSYSPTVFQITEGTLPETNTGPLPEWMEYHLMHGGNIVQQIVAFKPLQSEKVIDFLMSFTGISTKLMRWNQPQQQTLWSFNSKDSTKFTSCTDFFHKQRKQTAVLSSCTSEQEEGCKLQFL